MPLITPAELASRFRQRDLECERLVADDIPADARAQLSRTAEKYRDLASDLELKSGERAVHDALQTINNRQVVVPTGNQIRR